MAVTPTVVGQQQLHSNSGTRQQPIIETAAGGSSILNLAASNTTATPLQYALGLRPYSLVPNDPGKLRDVLHFIAAKAFQALDTFMVDELQSTANDTLFYELSLCPNLNNSFLCVPASNCSRPTNAANNPGTHQGVTQSRGAEPGFPPSHAYRHNQNHGALPSDVDIKSSQSNTHTFSNFSFNVLPTTMSPSTHHQPHVPLVYRDTDAQINNTSAGTDEGGLFNSITSVFRLGR